MKPNILLVYSDQHRFDCVGVNGHPLLQTPNLDFMARNGANFTNTFTPIPLCVPARCSMLSGQWPSEHGVVCNFDGDSFRPLDPQKETTVSIMRDSGYRTIHIGRWHVDPELTPIDYGADCYISDHEYNNWRKGRGIPLVDGWGSLEAIRSGQTDTHITPEESYLSWSADRVMDEIKSSEDVGKPFFLRWQMIEPHLPCAPPEPYASMYKPEDIVPWGSFGDPLEGKPYIQRQMLRNWNVEDVSWSDWADVVARYLGVITLLDDQIGRVIEYLEKHKLLENTIIIYTSDHGDMCGAHGMVDKHFIMYDDVVKVPMMVYWKGKIMPGTVIDEFISNAIDLPATFCDLAGVNIPSSFSGESIMPYLDGSKKEGREDIFASYHGNQFGAYTQRMVRNNRWKYIWNATDTDELYDLEIDPCELRNLINDSEVADELEKLKKRLWKWMEQSNDAFANQFIKNQLYFSENN